MLISGVRKQVKVRTAVHASTHLYREEGKNEPNKIYKKNTAVFPSQSVVCDFSPRYFRGTHETFSHSSKIHANVFI